MSGAQELPGRLRSPVALQSLRYGLDPERYFAAARRRHGEVFTVRLLGETWVVLGDPAAVKETFALGPADANSGEANFALRPLIGTRNVLLLDGPEHLARRKLLLPALHGERMRAYEREMRAASGRMIEEIPRGRPVAMLPLAQSLTFSVIMRCVFGVRDGERLDRLGDALRAMLGWVTDMRRALLFGVLGPQRLINLPAFRRQVGAVDEELANEISQRRDCRDLGEREDILSLLLLARDEQGQGLTDQELRDELATLLVAGHETTATAIAWALRELALQPELQRGLVGEDSDERLDAVIAETLRLHPPVPVVLRKLLHPRRIAGHDLPAGTTLAPCSLLVHRREDLYPDPWRFDGTRFLGRRPPASEWFPFGGATRRCIGAAFAQFEMRTVLEELTAALHFEPDRRGPERLGRRGPILVPARGARVLVSNR